MAKRGSGEGTVHRHKATGGWIAQVQVGVDANGRRLRKTVYGRTQAAVLEKLAKERERAGAGVWADPGNLKLGAYLTSWIEDVAAPRVRAGTLDYYRLNLRPVQERLGGVALRSLTPMHVQSLLRRMEQKGASARARQMTYAVLRTALRDALRMKLLMANPLDAVSRPRAPRPEIQALDAEQARALLAAAAGDPLEALYALALGTGLRLGELTGLRWRDVDLEAGAVHVRQTLLESIKGKITFGEPKTSKSRRQVDVPGFAIAALARHRGRLGVLPHLDRLVFLSSEGEPIRRSNLHRRSFKPLLARAGLPDVPFHALRHTAATLALAAGVNPKVVQERLGHSTITLTLDTYSHAVPTLGKDAADRLDTLLGYCQDTATGRDRGRQKAKAKRSNPPELLHAETH
ncbi:MAG: site-specific integrase [Myxococcota bacterium]|nr:site-specific integrase [Myxococcota bacterium]